MGKGFGVYHFRIFSISLGFSADSLYVKNYRIMMVQVIVLLEVKDAEAFQLFERQAVKIMKKYEGELVAAFEPDASESSSSNIAEIHYLQFPSIEAFKKYRADPQHLELSELRKKAISNTTVFVSGITKDYEH